MDLLLERRDGTLIAVEFKLGDSPGADDFEHLGYLREHLGERFKGGAVLRTGGSTLPFGDRLWACPASSLWA